MKQILVLSLRSLWFRRVPTILTVMSISMSVALFVGVDKIQEATRDAFGGAISKVDLIVGPRSGTLSLLLFSVFHVGSPTHNISVGALEFAKSRPEVDWVVPFSLGDGFYGSSVVGTTTDFFVHYKYRDGKSITYSQGQAFAGDSDAVVGAYTALKQNLKLGDKIVLSHGHTEDGDGFEKHEDHPFTVTGILAVTGTPIDKSVFVTLGGLGEIHRQPDDEARHDEARHDEADHDERDHNEAHQDEHEDHGSFKEQDGKLIATSISGFFLGAKNRMDSLNLQRTLNTWDKDALLAILPGMAMAELWRNLSIFETAMSLVSFCVVVAGILGLFVSLYIISGQRQREMTVLRAVGAGPSAIFGMLAGEAICLVLAGIGTGAGVMYAGLHELSPWIEKKFSISFPFSGVTRMDIIFAASMLGVGDGVTDDILEEDLEHTAGLLVDETGDTLDTSTTSETADGGLGDALDVIAKDLAVTLGASLSKSFASFSATRHD